MIVNDNAKVKHYDGDTDVLSDAIDSLENVKKCWYNSEYGMLYTFDKTTFSIFVRND